MCDEVCARGKLQIVFDRLVCEFHSEERKTYQQEKGDSEDWQPVHTNACYTFF